MGAGDNERALERLNQYGGRFPSGHFGPEATALKIEVLLKAGRTAEARALGERFVATHRGTPLGDRVAQLLGSAPSRPHP